MAKSVKDLPAEIQQLIEVSEWDLRTLEGLTRFKALGAKSLPSIALDETMAYEALIPEPEEITDRIKALYMEKNSGDLAKINIRGVAA